MESKIFSANQREAVQQFDLIHSKFSFGRSGVQPHPFKIFLYPFTRSTSTVQNFSEVVQLFTVSVSFSREVTYKTRALIG